jgi:hypothetical protein
MRRGTRGPAGPQGHLTAQAERADDVAAGSRPDVHRVESAGVDMVGEVGRDGVAGHAKRGRDELGSAALIMASSREERRISGQRPALATLSVT